jgi:hypothetical protein
MSCLGPAYLPVPPREWSRVQSSCTFDPVSTVSNIDPTVIQQQLKGNVLQYKKNSANFTKKQIYNQIAQGKWINRNTTWATQSQTFTNPNTQHLKRVAYTNLAYYPSTGLSVPTDSAITCPIVPLPLVFAFPPPYPPTYPPASSSSSETEPIIIPNGGGLVCGTRENICTGESSSQPTTTLCHPSSDSDVPGPLTYLCWNDGEQTWYPRQRYVMNNSTNKFPVNAPLFPIFF